MKTFSWWMNCVNLIKSLLHLRQSLCVTSVHDTNTLLQQLAGGTQPRPTSTPEHAIRPCGTPRDWGLRTAAVSGPYQALVAPTSPSQGLPMPWPQPCGTPAQPQPQPTNTRSAFPPQPQAASSPSLAWEGQNFQKGRSGACLARMLRRPQTISGVEGVEKVLKIQTPGPGGLARAADFKRDCLSTAPNPVWTVTGTSSFPQVALG